MWQNKNPTTSPLKKLWHNFCKSFFLKKFNKICIIRENWDQIVLYLAKNWENTDNYHANVQKIGWKWKKTFLINVIDFIFFFWKSSLIGKVKNESDFPLLWLASYIIITQKISWQGSRFWPHWATQTRFDQVLSQN